MSDHYVFSGDRQMFRICINWLFITTVLIIFGSPIIEASVSPRFAGSAAFAGSAKIGGRRMGCRAARVRLSSKLPGIGAAAKGIIFLNPRLLRRYPSVTRRMIFLHECGHQYVGASETRADCWAVKAAKRQGWLTERGVRTVCRSFANSPGSGRHPPGPARCSAMIACFRSAKHPRSKTRKRQ